MIPSPSSRRPLALVVLAVVGTAESFAFAPRPSPRTRPSHRVAAPSPWPSPSASRASPSGGTALSLSWHVDEATTQKLLVLTYEKLIDAGIPAVIFVLTSWWFFGMAQGADDLGRGRGGKRGGVMGGMMDGMMGSRRRERRLGRKGGGFDADGGGRPLGPVEELYDDIYDDLSGPKPDVNPLLLIFGGGGGGGPGKPGSGGGLARPTSRLNIGIPKQTFLKVTKLNSRYDSYRYSVVAATRGKAAAAKELRARGFEDALGRALDGGTSPGQGTALLELERDFLEQGGRLVKEAAALSREITNAAVLNEMEDLGFPGAGALDIQGNATAVIDAEVVAVDGGDGAQGAVTAAQRDFFGIIAAPADESNAAAADGDERKAESKDKLGKKRPKKIEKEADIMRAVKEVEALNTEILLLELDFLQSVVGILGPDRADAVRTAVVGNMINGEAGTLLRALEGRPLATVLSSLTHHGSAGHRPNLFVTRFPGDTTASQLNELREEVTGILRSAQPGDEALLVLQSGGGTVTGYGLAAGQLLRFKDHGMKLTVCVEQVAASGGYMMCCTADRIVASPFAVLGSIGVISEVPNAYERLKQEGIEFQTITAGKFKRTVTPTKKISKEDIKKSTEDIQEIFDLFKGFVKSQRPSLDIEDVATGDTWFGEDARARGLCDELGTADDVLLDFVDRGYDLYEVAYNPTPEGATGLLAGLPGQAAGGAVAKRGGGSGWRGVLRSAVRGVVSDVKEEVMAELESSARDVNSIERRFMAQDDSADRIQIKE